MCKRSIVMLAMGFALLSSGMLAYAEDSAKQNDSSGFDVGKQGDAKGGLERTAGKKTEDVKVPDASAPQPVQKSNGTSGGTSAGNATGNAGCN